MESSSNVLHFSHATYHTINLDITPSPHRVNLTPRFTVLFLVAILALGIYCSQAPSNSNQTSYQAIGWATWNSVAHHHGTHQSRSPLTLVSPNNIKGGHDVTLNAITDGTRPSSSQQGVLPRAIVALEWDILALERDMPVSLLKPESTSLAEKPRFQIHSSLVLTAIGLLGAFIHMVRIRRRKEYEDLTRMAMTAMTDVKKEGSPFAESDLECATQDDIAIKAIQACFSTQTLMSAKPMNEKKMGFSGASVKEILCEWKSMDNGESTPPEMFFVKHIVLGALPKGTSQSDVDKASRDLQSFWNEVHFLNNYAPALREKASVNIPQCYAITHTSPTKTEDGKEHFLFICESLTPLAQQVADYTPGQFASILKSMASMHALNHGVVDPPQDAATYPDPNTAVNEKKIWSQGTHLALPKRPSSELQKLPQIWADFCNNFEWPELVETGGALERAASYVADQLSPFNPRNKGRTTIVHGDLKPGNLFFGKADTCTDGGDQWNAYIFDFQWSGVGLAATDIVYLIAMGISDSHLEMLDVDKDVLQPYYQAFTDAYTSSGHPGPLEYTYEEFQADFQLALLDFVRWVVPCRLGGETPAKYAERRANADANLGAYRRSEVLMKFLMESVALGLSTTSAKAKDNRLCDPANINRMQTDDSEGYTPRGPTRFPAMFDKEQHIGDAWLHWERIGSPKFVMAPMVDQSELAFRAMGRKYGCDLAYTPMLHSRIFSDTPSYRKDHFTTNAGDRPLVVQFCANNPHTLLKAAQYVETECDAVDLNLGCPQHIARRGRYGAFLMEDWDRVYDMVLTLKQNLKVPVWAKIRVFPEFDKTLAYAKMIETAGASVICIHGRTREQKGNNPGPADLLKIRDVAAQLRVPVIANGNIESHADVQHVLKVTGCQGVMSAAGLLTNPALFSGQRLEPIAMAREYLSFADIYATHHRMIRPHLFQILYPQLKHRPNLLAALDKTKLREEGAEASYAPFLDRIAAEVGTLAEAQAEQEEVAEVPVLVVDGRALGKGKYKALLRKQRTMQKRRPEFTTTASTVAPPAQASVEGGRRGV